MTLPSKELMSEVLDTNMLYIEPYGECITYWDTENSSIDEDERNEILCREGRDVNIYELQHKIKEWSLNELISLESRYRISSDKCAICTVISLYRKELHFEAPTEFEAVVKAGEWVLAKMDGKDERD